MKLPLIKIFNDLLTKHKSTNAPICSCGNHRDAEAAANRLVKQNDTDCDLWRATVYLDALDLIVNSMNEQDKFTMRGYILGYMYNTLDMENNLFFLEDVNKINKFQSPYKEPKK